MKVENVNVMAPPGLVSFTLFNEILYRLSMDKSEIVG